MKIHEYQAKELFRKYGVPVPEGRVAFDTEEAAAAAEALGGYPVVVKAQIHAGGRGKGGGVKLAGSVEEVRSVAGDMIGMNLVTHQTGPQGREVKKVLVKQRLSAATERDCLCSHGLRLTDHRLLLVESEWIGFFQARAGITSDAL